MSIVLIFISVGFAAWLLYEYTEKRKKAAILVRKLENEEYRRRVQNPDLSGVEAVLKARLPEPLKELYSNADFLETIIGHKTLFLGPKGLSNDIDFDDDAARLESFCPLDKTEAQEWLEYCEVDLQEFFPFASNLMGNFFLVKVSQNLDELHLDSKIYFHDWEAAETFEVCSSLKTVVAQFQEKLASGKWKVSAFEIREDKP